MNVNTPPSSDPQDTCTLDQLRVGEPAVVRDVDAGREALARLQAMGLCAGQPIHTIRAGSRMIVCAAGTRIGLDRRLAASVTLTRLSDGPACGSERP